MNSRFQLTHSTPQKGHPVEAEKSQPHSVALRVSPSIFSINNKSFTLGET
jgi:hypothetical protein